jgi:hypothetical protein
MEEEVLQGVREKLRRAHEHTETLDREIGAYFDGEPHAYWTDADYDRGRYSVRITINTPPPVKLGVICGDVIHCLRSVLDHLVCSHVKHVTRQTAWPLYGKKRLFYERVIAPAWTNREGPLTGLDPEGPLFALIQEFQPYKGKYGYTEHPLWVLGQLSNAESIARYSPERQAIERLKTSHRRLPSSEPTLNTSEQQTSPTKSR